MSNLPNGSRRLPSLDGLRAIAVGIVIVAHAAETNGAPIWLRELTRFVPGTIGVQIFFTISGFIITHLLIREWQEKGVIDLRQFWIRRALRILPPLLLLLATISVIAAWGLVNVSTSSQWASVLFIRNHVTGGWFNGHLWSLSVEEQFYLCWPLLMMVLLTKKRGNPFPFFVVGALLARCFFINIHQMDWVAYSLVCNMDCIGLGCWLAWHLGRGRTNWPEASLQNLAKYWWMTLPVLGIISFSGSTRYAHMSAALQPLSFALVVTAIIQYNLSANQTWLFRLLNSSSLEWFGRRSYSIYLWQQIFLSPPTYWIHPPAMGITFPLNVLVAILFGCASFYLVERPVSSFRARARPLAAQPPSQLTHQCTHSGPK